MCFSGDGHAEGIELAPRPVRHARTYDDSGRYFDPVSGTMSGGYSSTTRPQRGFRNSGSRTDPLPDVEEEVMKKYADKKTRSIDQPASRAAGGSVIYTAPSRRGKEALQNEWDQPIFDERSRKEYVAYKKLTKDVGPVHDKYATKLKQLKRKGSGHSGLSKEAHHDLIEPAENWEAAATAAADARAAHLEAHRWRSYRDNETRETHAAKVEDLRRGAKSARAASNLHHAAASIGPANVGVPN